MGLRCRPGLLAPTAEGHEVFFSHSRDLSVGLNSSDSRCMQPRPGPDPDATSGASSGHGLRNRGVPLSTSNWQASAFASATCTGVKRHGRPERPPSFGAGSRPRTKGPVSHPYRVQWRRVSTAFRALPRRVDGLDGEPCGHGHLLQLSNAQRHSVPQARQGRQASRADSESFRVTRGRLVRTHVSMAREADQGFGADTYARAS